MRHLRTRSALWILVSLPLAAAAPVAPGPGRRDARETVAPEQDATTFDALTESIGRVADSGEWKRPSWKPAGLHRGLSKLVEQLKRATGRADLELPVEPADVRPPEEGNEKNRILPGSLVVCRDASIGFVARSIILADGDVSVAFANECVIVARGAVEISHGSRNVVLAGQFIHVSHDGNAPIGGARARPGSNGSVLVCGGYVDVSHATGTIVSAPLGVDISHATGVTFLDSPVQNVSHRHNCVDVKAGELEMAPRPKANPIETRVTLSRIAGSDDDRTRRFVVIKDGGAEVVIRPGQELHNSKGGPLAGLEGWKLKFVADGFALFSNGREDAAFTAPRRD